MSVATIEHNGRKLNLNSYLTNLDYNFERWLESARFSDKLKIDLRETYTRLTEKLANGTFTPSGRDRFVDSEYIYNDTNANARYLVGYFNTIASDMPTYKEPEPTLGSGEIWYNPNDLSQFLYMLTGNDANLFYLLDETPGVGQARSTKGRVARIKKMLPIAKSKVRFKSNEDRADFNRRMAYLDEVLADGEVSDPDLLVLANDVGFVGVPEFFWTKGINGSGMTNAEQSRYAAAHPAPTEEEKRQATLDTLNERRLNWIRTNYNLDFSKELDFNKGSKTFNKDRYNELASIIDSSNNPQETMLTLLTKSFSELGEDMGCSLEELAYYVLYYLSSKFPNYFKKIPGTDWALIGDVDYLGIRLLINTNTGKLRYDNILKYDINLANKVWKESEIALTEQQPDDFFVKYLALHKKGGILKAKSGIKMNFLSNFTDDKNQRYYNLESDFDSYLKSIGLDFSDALWDDFRNSVWTNETFKNYVKEKSASLYHSIENGNGFGSAVSPSEDNSFFYDTLGDWTNYDASNWVNSKDPAIAELKQKIKDASLERAGWTDDLVNAEFTNLYSGKRQKFEEDFRNTKAWQATTEWLKKSADNRLQYIQAFYDAYGQNPSNGARPAWDHFSKFVDVGEGNKLKWKNEAESTMDAIFGKEGDSTATYGRYLYPGNLWKSARPAVDPINEQVLRYRLNPDGTVSNIGDDDNYLAYGDPLYTYKYGLGNTNYTHMYYVDPKNPLPDKKSGSDSEDGSIVSPDGRITNYSAEFPKESPLKKYTYMAGQIPLVMFANDTNRRNEKLLNKPNAPLENPYDLQSPVYGAYNVKAATELAGARSAAKLAKIGVSDIGTHIASVLSGISLQSDSDLKAAIYDDLKKETTLKESIANVNTTKKIHNTVANDNIVSLAKRAMERALTSAKANEIRANNWIDLGKSTLKQLYTDYTEDKKERDARYQALNAHIAKQNAALSLKKDRQVWLDAHPKYKDKEEWEIENLWINSPDYDKAARKANWDYYVEIMKKDPYLKNIKLIPGFETTIKHENNSES